ncbi:branched-chain amino acid ABC transporter permease [Rhizobium sp. KVB221]|uniref:Branched-chain amino acid ABC transporter permease n=1 Tax=Rhizobium setariae TaxID=2801340 RepID=A0A936YL27_9HYPH|nr:branched-chain amino acid ABC transporter permease [Rhizobium setariae]MBL0372268.1 branched-chain amino acid ABC transporter permease [Rhizobium setariae]
MVWINAILQGVLLGGLYALFAAGLSLMFGVMRFINLAHGDFIVVAAYMALCTVDVVGFNPFAAVLLIVPAMALAGYLLQRFLFNRVLGQDILPPVLVTFGLSIVLQNVLLEYFGGNSQRLSAGALETASLSLGPNVAIGALPMLMFTAAVLVILLLGLISYHTPIGRMLRATADDPETVGLMGANNAHTFAIATAIATAVVAIAGGLFAMRTNFDPSAGPIRLLFAFEVVIIGGLGSLWGTLAGGIVLGIAQTVGGQIDPRFQLLAGHLIFLAILAARPQGLLSKGTP